MVQEKWKKIILILLLILGAAGAFAVLINPKNLGTTAAVPWGLLIGTYVLFAVSSTGVGLIGSLASVFGVSKFKNLSHKGPVISLILLLCGFGALALELGRPLNLFYILISPNFTSPIWWMGFFYTLYLALLVVEVYFIIKKDDKHLPLIEKISFFIKIAAVTNLGAIFSMNVSRPFWQGAYFPIIMIVSAIASGAAILAIISYFEKSNDSEFLTILGKILLGSLLIMGAGSIWKFISAIYSTAPADYLASSSLLNGGWLISFIFLEILIGIVTPVVLLLKWNFQKNMVIISSILAMFGLVFSRLNFISAGQMAPLYPRDSFAYFNSYSPSLSEWLILLGATGTAVILIITAAKKIFNNEPIL